MDNLLEYFERLGVIGAILCFLCIIYAVLSFLMPFFIISIDFKIDKLDTQVKMLQKKCDDIAYILIHQIDSKTADTEFNEKPPIH